MQSIDFTASVVAFDPQKNTGGKGVKITDFALEL